MFRIIIAGGRTITDYELVKREADRLLARKVMEGVKIIVVSGTARGADQLGERYAAERGYEVHQYPADWDTHGKSAGYKRNTLMAENADALMAFWDEKSRGTKHMIDIATTKGLPVRVIRY